MQGTAQVTEPYGAGCVCGVCQALGTDERIGGGGGRKIGMRWHMWGVCLGQK